ncbi:MAG TPA: ABC transporter permease [Clostridium sp.]|nr:ABC transporter permease [Clostridium sp.]
MNIYKMEVKKGFKSLLIWTVTCVLLTILFMSMFPSMKDSGMQELVKTKLDIIPPAFLKALGLDDAPDFSKLNEYFAYVFQYIMMAGVIYGGLLGSKALIKEESEGTIEFLYAQPVKRSKIVTMKILSAATLFTLFVFIMALSSILKSLAVKSAEVKVIDVLMDYKLLFSGFFMVGLVFMAVGFAISVLVPHLRLAMPISIGSFFVTFLLGMFSDMIEKLSFLKYFSPFHFANPADVVKNGIKTDDMVLALIFITVATVVTYTIYRKKNFRI